MKKRIISLMLSLMSLALFIPVGASAQSNAENKTAADENTLKAGFKNFNTVTENQPFVNGTGGSENFRIPAFTVLKDGSLFAAADARYETTGDGGGLDTMVALSGDNGKTWNHSYAILYPDSNGFADNQATTCIDPVVVQGNDGTIYVAADMNPTGVTTMKGFTRPNYGTGYITIDGVERLALTDDYSKVNNNPDSETETYPYYLGDFENGYAPVLSTKDNSPSKWVLDSWWNIYEVQEDGSYAPVYQKQVNSEAEVQQNAFYRDSALHVYNTGYIMMSVSKDNGKTWEPRVINTQIKRDDENALLVSPGKGTVASDGTIIIPFYNWYAEKPGLVQNASFIWSKDDGKTWHRTEDTHNANGVNWNSESEIVEVHNGTLRMFVRNETGKLVYIDANWDEKTGNYMWSDPVVTSAKVTSTCNVTAITYSKKIDGKTAVMVAAPTGPKRAGGKIFTFLVNEDNSMELKYVYRVNVFEYAYSCMDELPDGSIGLLYEPTFGKMKFEKISVDSVTAHGVNFEISMIVLGASAAAAGVAAAVVGAVKKFRRKRNKN